jgi:hypothetical protein
MPELLRAELTFPIAGAAIAEHAPRPDSARGRGFVFLIGGWVGDSFKRRAHQRALKLRPRPSGATGKFAA